MKKVLKFAISAFALSLLVQSCTKTEEMSSASISGVKTNVSVTVNAAQDPQAIQTQSSDTRIWIPNPETEQGLKPTWQTGDEISVHNAEGDYVGSLSTAEAGASVIFSGDVTVAEGVSYTAVYPAHTENLASRTTTVEDLAQTTTNPGFIGKVAHFASASSFAFDVETSTFDPITFSHEMSYIKLVISRPENYTKDMGKISKVAIKNSESLTLASVDVSAHPSNNWDTDEAGNVSVYLLTNSFENEMLTISLTTYFGVEFTLQAGSTVSNPAGNLMLINIPDATAGWTKSESEVTIVNSFSAGLLETSFIAAGFPQGAEIPNLKITGAINNNDILAIVLRRVNILDLSEVSGTAFVGLTNNGSNSLWGVIVPGGEVGKGTGVYAPSNLNKLDLRSVKLPSTVNNLGTQSFNGVTSLVNFEWSPAGNAAIKNTAFRSTAIPTEQVQNILNISAYTTIEYATFRAASAVTEITIPAQITKIGSYAFYETPITKITLEGILELTPDNKGVYADPFPSRFLKDGGDGSIINIPSSGPLYDYYTTHEVFGLYNYPTPPTLEDITVTVASLDGNAMDDADVLQLKLTSTGEIRRIPKVGNLKAAIEANPIFNGYSEGAIFEKIVVKGDINVADFQAVAKQFRTVDMSGANVVGYGIYNSSKVLSTSTDGVYDLLDQGVILNCIPDGAFSYSLIGADGNVSFSTDGKIVKNSYFAGSEASVLEVFVYPSNITTLGYYAFEETLLTEVAMPESIVVVPFAMLKNCKSLTSVTLHNKISNIGGQAFSGCDQLSTLNILHTAAEAASLKVGSIPFPTILTSGEGVVYVPDAVEAYAGTAIGSTGLRLEQKL